MTGVFYFINQEDNIVYFMTGVEEAIFTPIPEHAFVYTLSSATQPYSFTFSGQTAVLNVSTRADLEFRFASSFTGIRLKTLDGTLAIEGNLTDSVVGVRYRKAIINCDGLIVGQSGNIRYLQFPNRPILFSLKHDSAVTISSKQAMLNIVHDDKADPQKGQAKRQVTETISPYIKASVYILVILAILVLFAIVRTCR